MIAGLTGCRHNLPPDVEALFVKQPPIKDVIEFALGDHGTYFISYRDDDGQVYCSKDTFFGSPHVFPSTSTPLDLQLSSRPVRIQPLLSTFPKLALYISHRSHCLHSTGHYNLPNPLTEYLYHGHPHVIRDLATLSISLGPYESYYAHDKTSASWANLPPVLEKAIEHRLLSQDAWKTLWKENGREAPSFVSLGADGSYFMRTVGGGGSWDLKSKEEGIMGTNKFLENSKDFSGVAVRPFTGPYFPLLKTLGCM